MHRFILVLLILLAAGSAFATTYGIYPDGSGAYPTIQAAVNATVAGDRVILMPGTYTGPGNTDVVVWQDITIRANDGLGSVIIDCEQQPRAFVLEYSDATIEGLIIRNGSYTRGGAVSIEGGHPTFESCTFEDNTATEEGGAMHIYSEAQVTLDHCAFGRNHSDGQGGAIYVRESSTLDITRGTFVVNGSDEGGHIYMCEDSDLSIDTSILAYGYGGAAVKGYYNGDTTVHCTDVFGNRGGDWVHGLQGEFGTSNYQVDPMFIDAVGGDYRLYPLSTAWQPGDCGAIGSTNAVAGVLEDVVYGLRPEGRGMFEDLDAAMAAVPDGGVIVLEDGIYVGAGYRDLNPDSREMTIRSRSGDPTACILDADASGSDNHRLFFINSGEGSPFTVQGLTLRGAVTSGEGGLLYVGLGAQPIFENCIFGFASALNGNTAYIEGTPTQQAQVRFTDCEITGHIHSLFWDPQLEGCTFNGSSASVSLIHPGSGTIGQCLFQDNQGMNGGAIFIREGQGQINIQSTDFDNCRAVLDGPGAELDGGAIYMDSPGDITMSGCNFTGCYADSSASDIYVFGNTPGNTLSLEGCHFTASGEWNHDNGGSIYLFNVDTDFSECTWDGYLTTAGRGGAIYCLDSEVSLVECRISNSDAYLGGGIYSEGGRLTLDSVGIYDNRANGGGGIYARSPITCDWGSFKRNQSDGSGGALTLSGTQNNSNFDRTTFSDNTAETSGGAIYLGYQENSAHLNQCTIYHNSVLAPAGFPGQIQVVDNTTLELYHTLITHGNNACAVAQPAGQTPFVTSYCCNVFGNDRGDWIGPIFGQGDDDENLSVDPLFCDTSGTLYVDATSACLPDNNACSTLIGAWGQGCDQASPVPDTPVLVSAPVLRGAHPNPFNPQTTIAYELPRDAAVTLVVHDVSGRVVRTLRSGVMESAGSHDVAWNGLDDAGQPVGSGVYLVRLATAGVSQVQRVALIK